MEGEGRGGGGRGRGRPGRRVEGVELRKRLREWLPGYMVPGVIVRLEKLPLTGHGKVDRKRLGEEPLVEERVELKGEEEGEGSAVEEIVAGIWREVLGLEE